jgi:hypothetical protein
MKKMILALTAAAVVTSMTAASTSAMAFTDMKDTENVVLTQKLGIASGYYDGSFMPNATITRAETVKMIIEAVEPKKAEELAETDSTNEESAETFTDVNSDHWAYRYIQEAVKEGIIEGCNDGTFRPDEDVTNEQLATMLVCSLGYKMYATARGGYPSGYVRYAKTLGITEGFNDYTAAAKRGEVLDCIANMLNVPICVEAGYSSNMQTGVMVPEFAVKDGEGKDFRSLLTINGIYKTNAAVTQVNKDTLELELSNTVSFDDEEVPDGMKITVKASEDDIKSFEKGKNYTIYIKVNDSEKKDYEIVCGFLAD